MNKTARLLVTFAALAAVVALAAVLLRPRETRAVTPATERTQAPSQSTPAPAETTSDNSQTADTPNSASNSSLITQRSSLLLVGSVVADNQASLSVRLPSRIVAVNVREGDRVRAGQLLVQLDESDVRAQIRTAQAGLAAARAQVRKAEAGRNAQIVKADADIESARAGLRQAEPKRDQARIGVQAAQNENRANLVAAREAVRKAQAALDRANQMLTGLRQLATVGGVSRSDLEGAQTQVTVAESDLRTAQAQAQQLETGSGAGADSGGTRAALARDDLRAAQAGVQQAQAGIETAIRARGQVLQVAAQDIAAARAAQTQAQAGLDAAQSQLSQTRIVSPINGVASQVGARVGETAQPGQPLVALVGESGLRVDALATARQLAALRVGQSATVTLDTRPGVNLPAVVAAISPTAEPDGRSFRVTFRLRGPGPPAGIRPSQTARIAVSPRP